MTTASRPITVISHTGRRLRRHVHATNITRGGLPVVTVDDVPFVLGPVRVG